MYSQLMAVNGSEQSQPQAIALVMFEKPQTLPEHYAELDRTCGGVLGAALGRSEFSAGKGTLQTLYPPAGSGAAARLFVLGLGAADAPRASQAEQLRLAGAKLVRACAEARLAQVNVLLTAELGNRFTTDFAGRALADGLAMGNVRYEMYKGAARGEYGANQGELPELSVGFEADGVDGATRALRIGEAAAAARQLAATPPNVANPAYLADYCRDMAKRLDMQCQVINAEEAARLKLNGLLAVGRAGSTPPALIVLEWNPDNRSQPPILLVGKAVTFDTGGYSLKPTTNMTSMKYDKCGGTTVIGAMQAIATLKLPHRVVALIPAVENMISREAYRPDDILTLCNGVTVEVTNTDAEGRLILADALAYGTQTYQPQAVVDLATLTGGVIIALGDQCAGAFCEDAKLFEQLQQAAEHSGEIVWRLPLWPAHREMMKSAHADLVNSGERKAHPIQGAAFLSHFVGPDAPTRMPTIPWAHLDIAGVANVDRDTPLHPKGPTGWGVRLLTRLVETWTT